MSNNPFAGLPNNKFGNAFDLSSLKAPSPADLPTYGKAVTQSNLVAEFVKESNNQVVVLLCWSPRSAQAKEILEVLGKLETADKNTWLLGTVNVDTEAAVAQALQEVHRESPVDAVVNLVQKKHYILSVCDQYMV